MNQLALSTDYVMRTGAFDPAKATMVHKDNKLSGKFVSAVEFSNYLPKWFLTVTGW